MAKLAQIKVTPSESEELTPSLDSISISAPKRITNKYGAEFKIRQMDLLVEAIGHPSKDDLIQHMHRLAKFICAVDPSNNYKLPSLYRAITDRDPPSTLRQDTISGKQLFGDLGLLYEKLSTLAPFRFTDLNETYLTTKEASKLLGVNERTLTGWRERGLGGFWVLKSESRGLCRVYLRSDLRLFIEARSDVVSRAQRFNKGKKDIEGQKGDSEGNKKVPTINERANFLNSSLSADVLSSLGTLRRNPLQYVESPEFSHLTLDQVLLETRPNETYLAPRKNRAELHPDVERWLFRRYNFLKMAVCQSVSEIKDESPDNEKVKITALALAELPRIRAELIRANLGIVKSLAGDTVRHRSFKDQHALEEVGVDVLERSIELFDYTRGMLFVSYLGDALVKSYKRLILRHAKREGADLWIDSDALKSMAVDRSDPSIPLQERERRGQIVSALRQLPRPQRIAIKEHFGWFRSASFEEIGARLKVTGERAKQILLLGLKKLAQKLPVGINEP